ncbi:hypothetical protein [Clostridium beijerinckii]|uniref:Uncharacterized protein n=1 Tax=Clostridium beijerinckii TaxID=1520 RepID=A0A1S8S151_CLOBE|nr:hypothetical protein [Clostridium beijerinckii]NRY64175.1 hypothetical protein [Clostridium beijerinckii]OOM59164.1 hypothetical protein CLBCK_36150 [Clostridium beijerinckii]
MFKLTCIDFFFRTIPETFILIYGMHIIAQKPVNLYKYILSSLILSILIFFIRKLPIYFGVHTDICIMLTIIIVAFIKDIPLIKNVLGTFLLYFMLSLSETINMLLLDGLNINTDISVLQPLTRCIYGIPSLITFIISVIILRFILKNKRVIPNYF